MPHVNRANATRSGSGAVLPACRLYLNYQTNPFWKPNPNKTSHFTL